MNPKVIFIDSVHSILFERLEKSGYECEWKTDLKRSELLSIISDYSGAVIRSKFKFDREMLDAANQLKWIARSGAGMENIDLEYANEKRIKCFNSPEGNRDAVAEHALGMILTLFNKLNSADIEVRAGMWEREKNRGVELKGKTVGILGYGYMGKAFATRLKGFGVKIIAYDKYKSDFGDEYVQEVELSTLFKQTDILSIHLPLTQETNGMIDWKFLQQFQKEIYLINTARGKNLKVKALIKGLESNKVKGACLDVLEYESTSFENADLSRNEYFQYLSQSDKVLLSPHVAGWTQESYFKLSDVLADKILASSFE